MVPDVGSWRERSYAGDYMEAGLFAEEVCLAFFRSQDSIKDVMDLRGERHFQLQDVDFGLVLDHGGVTKAEVKSDKWLGKSGNVLFEMFRVYHTARPEACCVPGWSVRSEASWFFMYAPWVQKIYQIKASDFRRGFQLYTQEVRGGARLSFVETDKIKSAINCLVPEEYFAGKFRIHDVEEAWLGADDLREGG